jgi:hypothetical protein
LRWREEPGDDLLVLLLLRLGDTVARASDREESSAVIALEPPAPRGRFGLVATPVVRGDGDGVHPSARRREFLVAADLGENLGGRRVHLAVDDAVIEVVSAQRIVGCEHKPEPVEGAEFARLARRSPHGGDSLLERPPGSRIRHARLAFRVSRVERHLFRLRRSRLLPVAPPDKLGAAAENLGDGLIIVGHICCPPRASR